MSVELYTQIETAFPSITGWCSLQRAEELAAMIVALQPDVSCVVGVWGGKETIPMAMAHRFVGRGKVFAVDPWAASSSVDGQDKANADWWGNQKMHDDVYAMFTAKVRELGLEDWVVINRARSDVVEIPAEIGVAVIDGNHGPQAIDDVRLYALHVPLGGIMYLDDLHWSGGNVEKAAELALSLGFKRLRGRDTGAFFQRVR